MRKLNQEGSTLLVLLAAVLLGVVGFAGYRVYSAHNVTPASSITPVKTTSAPTTIKTASDLKKASAALDNDQADKKLDPTQLNGDLSSLF